MHGSIRNGLRDRLEDLLQGKRTAVGPEGLLNHLHSCQECSSEFETMQAHSELFRSLRSAEEVDAAPGFYARVMQRIEERAKQSIWAFWVYTPFGRRLTFASFALAILLGSYFIAEESRDGHLMAHRIVAQAWQYDVAGSQAQQRDAVLENFGVEQGSVR